MFERIVATVIDRPEADGVMVTFTDSDGAPDVGRMTWMAHDMDNAMQWVEIVTKRSLLVLTPLAREGTFSVSVLEDEE